MLDNIFKSKAQKQLELEKQIRAKELSDWKTRSAKVISALTSETGPLRNYPYIESGTYHWVNVDRPIQLEYVFQDLPLAVIITRGYYGVYDKSEECMPDRHIWEAYMRHESERIHTCALAGFPTLVITPNDPIDEYSLALSIEKLLNEAEEESEEDEEKE